jgi:hypothetical protein
MNVGVITKKISLFFLIICVTTACRKNDISWIEDGTPGDGATVPAITVDTSIKNVDVSKYSQARVFPGLVCAAEPRGTFKLSMNLNYNLVDEELRINVPPQPQFSTGLYAAPGELLIVDVPSGDYSLSIQVGAWTDNLSSIQNAPRDAVIYSRSQLAPGRNYVRNLYGGHIYIYAARPITTPVNLTFTNAVKSPDFVLGETTNAAWQAAIRSSCVPYLELRSKNMVFVVPREYCVSRPIADPTALMTEWDNAINLDYYKWEGLEENPTDPIDKAPLLPWRVVQDIKPSLGYGHSGFPVVTFNDLGWFDEFTDINQIRGGGCWGTFHEIGHNNQQPRYWSWSSLGETSNNLFAFKVAHRQEALYPTAWPPKHPALPSRFATALAFALDPNSAKNFDGTDDRINDPFSRLTPFVQIFDKVKANFGYQGQPDGWNFMSELYKKARRASRISANDQDKRDFVYEALCDFTRQDWQLFFKAWGITISNISIAKMSTIYPLMTQEIWKYNPLTRSGGDSFIDLYSRSLWTVTANSFATNEGTNGYVSNLVDGNLATYWHSNYGTGTGPTAPPFAITVDMQRVLPVKGFSVALRNSGTGVTTAVKNIKVEVSNDNSTWTAVTTFSPQTTPNYITLAKIQGLQNFVMPSTISFRYFRFTIPTAADNDGNSSNSALSEINVIKP